MHHFSEAEACKFRVRERLALTKNSVEIFNGIVSIFILCVSALFCFKHALDFPEHFFVIIEGPSVLFVELDDCAADELRDVAIFFPVFIFHFFHYMLETGVFFILLIFGVELQIGLN